MSRPRLALARAAALLALAAPGCVSFEYGRLRLDQPPPVAGVQALGENLVALGLVEQMQVGMAMGMMMAFAQPGAEPDTFTSKIEFKDGGIFANGQPIQ